MYAQSFKFAQLGKAYSGQKRTSKPTVYWFHGPTGCGKSWNAFQMAAAASEDPYVTNEATGGHWWWDGYDGHKFVICDDFRKSFISWAQLLRLLDRYPYQVEFKGGYTQLLATTIVITCAFSPTELYADLNEDINQLLRRIDHIVEYNVPYVDKAEEENDNIDQ